MGPNQTIEEFERELVAWLDAVDAPDFANSVAWSRRLGEARLLAPGWPPEHGGLGLERAHVKLLEAALRERGIRRGVNGGLEMLAPVLLEYATPEQLVEFLPPIARAEAMWAQGYSEPQAGSDLANVQMRCENRGDHYLVNGQKIWTSGADESDWIFCLVRTDPRAPKHDGISFLLVDLTSPGIRVSPIVLISGRSPFCEVFFEDVRVPKRNLVGGVGRGWPIAKRLLQFERSMLGSGGLSALTGSAGRKSLADVAREQVGLDDAGALRDAALRERVARQLVVERANRLTGARARGADATRVSSILKLASSEANQQRYSLLMDLLGTQGLGWRNPEADAYAASIPKQWLRSRANTIEGGTSEVQLNIIAKRVLGLVGQGAGGVPDQSLARGDEQSMIREAALQLLQESQPIAELRALRDGDEPAGFSPRLWQEIVGLGWPGLLAPDTSGGAGLGFQEAGVIHEALGRYVVPTPLLSTGVLATCALGLVDGWADFPKTAGFVSGDTRGRARARGVLALRSVHDRDGRAVQRRGASSSMVAKSRCSTAPRPRWCWWWLGSTAKPTRWGSSGFPSTAPGVRTRPVRWIDGRRVAEIWFDGAMLDRAALLGNPIACDAFLEPLIDRAAAVVAAELVGISARALEMTVEYLQTREQFGQKLAEFQALQHRCARMFAEVERIISLVQAALRALDDGDDDASLLASGAKATAADTARHVTEEALQLHGGIGMTEEHDIGLYFKRARASAAVFGDSTYHYRRVARSSGF